MKRHNALQGVTGKEPSSLVLLTVLIGAWVGLLGVWEVAAQLNYFSRFITPAPSEIANQLHSLVTQGLDRGIGGRVSLGTILGLTTLRVVPWVAFGAVLGYFVAVWITLTPRLRYFALSVVTVLYSVSALAVFLMLQGWLGFTDDPKYGISLWVGFSIQVIIVYVHLYSLLYDQDKVDAYLSGVLDTLTLAGISPLEFLRRHSWPLLHKQAWIALTVAIVLAFKLAVITDPSGGTPEGVGTLIAEGYQVEGGGAPLVYAGTFLLTSLVIISWAVIAIFKRITRPMGIR